MAEEAVSVNSIVFEYLKSVSIEIANQFEESASDVQDLPESAPKLSEVMECYTRKRKISVENNENDNEAFSKKAKSPENEHNPLEIMAFPDEVLLMIFRNLSSYNILKQIAPVCKRFHRLSQDKTVITEVYITGNLHEPCDMYKTIKKSEYLTSLIIHSHKDAEGIIRFALKNCQNFKHLELKVDDSEIDLERMNSILNGSFEKFVHLDLDYEIKTGKKPDGHNPMFNVPMKNLKYLNISGPENSGLTVSTENLIALAKGSEKLETLKLVSVSLKSNS